MYRIRFHGRGGQGIKTGGRVLGTAFFIEGYEVQDAPRYGAERRGAPIFAYVRADRSAINERGIIRNPDLIVVADDSLVPLPGAGVTSGAKPQTVLLINSMETAETWKSRLNYPGPVVVLPSGKTSQDRHFSGAICAGAAARLIGVISSESLKQAIYEELSHLGPQQTGKNLESLILAYDLMDIYEGSVREGGHISAGRYSPPDWIEMPFESAITSTPAIYAAATSVEVKTGLWRTMRPRIDYDRCNRCWWICSTLCPDGVISLREDGYPEIDYNHCKGCMVCVTACLRHSIEAVPESGAGAGA